MNTRNFIINFLGLQGFRVGEIRFENEEWLISVKLERRTANCPICGKRSKCLHSYLKERKIFHKLWGDKKIFLVGRKRRWRCKSCGRVFTESWPAVNKWARKTEEAEGEILKLLRDNSFNKLEERWDISDGVARRVISKLKAEPNWVEERQQKKIRLGVDEHSFRGRELVITITNLSKRQVKAILPDDRQETLRNFLLRIPEEVRLKIVEVCIDMKPAFVEVIKEVLPHTKIVIDHFHVIQDANRRVDDARRIEQEAVKKTIKKWVFVKGVERLDDYGKNLLQSYFTKYPLLKEWHWGKEQLRNVYKAKSKEEAHELLMRIIRSFEEHDDAAMNDWGKTLRRWKEYILNYFDHKTTNSYTEGAHTKMKFLKRMSYGFKNIEVYIKKMMLAFVPVAMIPLLNLHHTF